METIIIKGDEVKFHKIPNNVKVFYIADWSYLDYFEDLPINLEYIIIGGTFQNKKIEKIQNLVNKYIGKIPFGCQILYLEPHKIIELNNREVYCIKLTKEIKPYFKFGKVMFLQDGKCLLPNHNAGREYYIYHNSDMEKVFYLHNFN